MKLLIAVVASAAILASWTSSNALAQNPRVPESQARTPGQPIIGEPQTTNPSTEQTTGQAPIRVPGEGNPYGARGGAIPGVPNPDRVPPDTPGGQGLPPTGPVTGPT